MKSRLLLSCILGLFITWSSTSFAGGATTYQAAQEVSHRGPQINTTTIQLPAFTDIQTNGQFDITIQSGKRSEVTFYTPTDSNTTPSAKVQQGTLMLSGDTRFFHNATRIQATVTTPHLEQVTLGGQAHLKGTVSGQNLVLNTTDHAAIDIKSIRNLLQVNAGGQSYTSIRGIRSTHLSIKGQDHAIVALSGRTDHFTANMYDESQLYAGHLAFNHATVQTYKNAFAEVSHIKGLNAFAYDNSGIFLPNGKDDIKFAVADRHDYIDAIRASGKTIINLHNGIHPEVAIRSQNGLVGNAQFTVKNHTLIVHSDNPVLMDVYLPFLSSLHTDGYAVIKGQNITGHRLSIENTGSANIDLTGKLDLTTVAGFDSSVLRLHWVDSPELTIHGANQSVIELAGVANWVKASLQDNARLVAGYLRAKRNWIRTQDFASAYVESTENLRGFAYDNSQIYSYKWPRHTSYFSTSSGNILQAGWHN